jgi:hypothetical protein
MADTVGKQHCVVCAWRENCAKKFRVTDGGAHCPDFTRDVTIKAVPEDTEVTTKKGDKI